MSQFSKVMLFLGLAVGILTGFVAGYKFGRSEQAESDQSVQNHIAASSFRSTEFRDQIMDATARLARVSKVSTGVIMSEYEVRIVPTAEDLERTVCVLLLPKGLGLDGDATFCYRFKTTELVQERLGE